MNVQRPSEGVQNTLIGVRARRGRATYPPDPYAGHAMLPHCITRDERLKASDVRVAAALLSFAWGRAARCRPSNKRIAELACMDPATVKRALDRLEAAGHVRREKVSKSSGNPTGREIVLAWRAQGGEAPTAGAGRDPARAEEAPTIGAKCATRPARNAPLVGAPVRREEESSSSRTEDPRTPEVATLIRTVSQSRVQRDETRRQDVPTPHLVPRLSEALPPRLPAVEPLTPKREAAIREKLRQAETGGHAGAADYYRRLLAASRPAPSPRRPVAPPVAGEPLPAPLAVGDPLVLDTLGRLGPGSNPHLMNRAVSALCLAFKPTDLGEMQGAYQQVVEDVGKGFLPAAAVVYAYRRAAGPGLVNRGAVFKANLDAWCRANLHAL